MMRYSASATLQWCSHGVLRLALSCGLAGVLVAGTAAGSAAAATVRLDQGATRSGITLEFRAGAGERNDVTVVPDGETDVLVRDGSSSVNAQSGCSQVDSNTARCPARPLVVVLEDGDDRFHSTTLASAAYISGGDGEDSLSFDVATDPRTTTEGPRMVGGAGNDRIVGAGGYCTLEGGPGDDQILGGAVGDRLRGGGGRDEIRGGDGPDALEDGDGSVGPPADADVLDGGPGLDVVVYAARTADMVVDLSAGTGGQSGEGDVLTSIDGVTAGSGNDRLLGGDTAEYFDGRAGDDYIDARGGDDGNGRFATESSVVTGGAGSDTVLGGAGDDYLTEESDMTGRNRLDGGEGSDYVAGGDSNDTLMGGAGRDDMAGGSGVDVIDGGAGDDDIVTDDKEFGDRLERVADRLRCGGGRDVVGPDGSDLVPRDCEQVKLYQFRLDAHPRVRAGTLRIRVGCPKGRITVCRVSLATVRRGKVVGSDRASLRAGRSALLTARVPLRRAGYQIRVGRTQRRGDSRFGGVLAWRVPG